MKPWAPSTKSHELSLEAQRAAMERHRRAEAHELTLTWHVNAAALVSEPTTTTAVCRIVGIDRGEAMFELAEDIIRAQALASHGLTECCESPLRVAYYPSGCDRTCSACGRWLAPGI